MSEHAASPAYIDASTLERMKKASADNHRSVLLIADAPQAALPMMILKQLGARLLECAPIRQGAEKLAQLIAVDVIILRCDGVSAHLETLITDMVAWTRENDTALIVSVDMEALDLAYSLLSAGAGQLLCEPSDMELATTIGIALRAQGTLGQLADIGRETDTARLQRLSQELGWLAGRLADLPTPPLDEFDDGRSRQGKISDRQPSYRAELIADLDHGGMPARTRVTHGQVRSLIRARRLRTKLLDPTEELFADPAWDMMLDLLAARLENKDIAVSSLCIAANVPPTTALRWISVLSDRGIVRRKPDPKDKRRFFIALSDEKAAALIRWFEEIGPLLSSGVPALDPGRVGA